MRRRVLETTREAHIISKQDVDRISDGWVETFSVDPYVVKQRDMEAWHELDRLIYDRPEDALLVFETIAEKDLINWTFEGLAVGPLRTFLMLYGESYDKEVGVIRRRNKAFDKMHAMATKGM